MTTAKTSVIEKWSMNPGLRRLLRLMGLNRLARAAYARLFRPSDGVFRAETGTVAARFVAPSPAQFRALAVAWASERTFIDTVVQSLKPGDVFWDVGSSHGMFTIFGAHVVGSSGAVYAFEPESEAFEGLQKNVALNALSNVRMMPVALSDHDGSVSFATRAPDASAQSPRIVADGTQFAQKIRVAVADGLSLPVPQAVKIDVEGHEFAVLHGMKHTIGDRRCQIVLCEVHPTLLPAGVTETAVEDFLRNLGFTDQSVIKRDPELHLIARRPSSS